MPIKAQDADLFDLIRAVWRLLTDVRKRQFKLLIVLMLISSAMELISIGSLIPFLNSITDPDATYQKFIESNFLQQFISPQRGSIVVWMALAFSIIAMASACVKIIVIWGTARVAFSAGADISLLIYTQMISQPYTYYLSIKSNEVIDVLSAKVHSLINSVLIPSLYLVNAVLMTIIIVIGLIYVDYRIALFIAVIYSTLYLLILRATKNKLNLNSQSISNSSPKLIQITQAALGGIRDIIIDSSRNFFIQKFIKLNYALRSSQSNSAFIANCPKSILEAFGLILISSVVIIKSENNSDLISLIGILGVLVLASQKLLPLMQSAYASISSLRENKFSIIDILGYLSAGKNLQENRSPIVFEKSIELRDLVFSYSPEALPTISKLNLKIGKGTKTGLVGKTGSGKSTLIDLLMGLLQPNAGEILIDGEHKKIYNNQDWFEKIAHVPQNIYLVDGTIAENIAFGIDPMKIDYEKLYKAAKVSHISEFVERLEGGYQTQVGEAGSLLSGGQRQRIGIARALYKNAQILIFDEATSALDPMTERSVLDAIHTEFKGITILSIAHRKEVLIGYDQIFELGSEHSE